jgi:hypothetical protein
MGHRINKRGLSLVLTVASAREHAIASTGGWRGTSIATRLFS